MPMGTLAVGLRRYLNRYNISMIDKERSLEWIASSYKDLMALPPDVRRFQKKSKSGIATPKGDMDIIRARLKVAEALAQELRNAKTNH